MPIDPLQRPKPLIDRVYAYVAYRVRSRADSEDITSEVFERALRYRSSYDPSRGEPLAWLIGIARRCIDDWRRQQGPQADADEWVAGGDHAAGAIERLAIADALGSLEPRERELIALRYGADLSSRQIATLLDMQTNAVDVALHRARGRLKELLADDEPARPVQRLRSESPPTNG
jgi:RNA polymerase sigma-70 factor (ECF subfamily)